MGRRNLTDQIPPVYLTFSGCFIQPPLGRPDPQPLCGTSASLEGVQGPRSLSCAVVWPVARGRDWHSQAANRPAEGGAVKRLREVTGSGSWAGAESWGYVPKGDMSHNEGHDSGLIYCLCYFTPKLDCLSHICLLLSVPETLSTSLFCWISCPWNLLLFATQILPLHFQFFPLPRSAKGFLLYLLRILWYLSAYQLSHQNKWPLKAL